MKVQGIVRGAGGNARGCVVGLLLAACAAPTSDVAAVDQPIVTTQKLADFSTERTSAASSPAGFSVVNGSVLFFSAQRRALFRSDGTPGGTRMVRDLAPTFDSEVPRIVVLGGRGYWTQDQELWTSDGTPAGTMLVTRFPDPRGFDVSELVVFSGALYLGTAAGLVRSDGTAAGTQVVSSISASGPWHVSAGKLYFPCATPREGGELCVSDGTAAGTKAVADLVPGIGASSAIPFGVVGARVLFTAITSGFARGLWATDGTAAGTVQLVAPTDGDVVSQFASAPAILGGIAWLACYTQSRGVELCRTNGTVAGTAIVELVPGAASLEPTEPVALAGRLVFSARRADVGRELWSSNGTAAGTVLVKDLLPGPFDGLRSAPVAALGGALYFAAQAVLGETLLWKTDGTTAGTTPIKQILMPGAPESFPLQLADAVALGTRLVFAADDGVTSLEPWATDGTEAGTQLLADLVPARSSFDPLELRDHQGATYLTAGEGQSSDLWRSDGTVAGTVKRQHGEQLGMLTELTPAGYWLYFQGDGLWKTDGAATTAIPLPGGASELRAFGDGVAFSGTTPNFSFALWLSDGTVAGTRLTDPQVLNARGLGVAHGQLWLSGLYGGLGNELWTSDGTTTGVRPVKDINPGFNESRPAEFVELGAQTVFVANDGVSGNELWKTDGTEAGTVRILDLVPGATGSNPRSLLSWNGRVLFAAGSFTQGALWITDGTAAGTTQLGDAEVDFDPGFVAWGDLVFFTATDALGTELWRTDGTAAGTVQVSDLAAGLVSSNPRALRLIGRDGPLVFAAEDALTGREVWQLAQPLGVPQLVADLAPGPASSRPTAIGVQGDALIVTADAGDGYAIWRIAGVGTDATPPVLRCPADVTVMTRDASAIVRYTATATDDAGGTPVITADHASGSVFPRGVTTVRVAATDASNNASRCTFVVEVAEEAAPGSDAGAGSDGGPGDPGPGDPGPGDPGPRPDAGVGGNPGAPGESGGCSTTRNATGGSMLIALALVLRRRRRARG